MHHVTHQLIIDPSVEVVFVLVHPDLSQPDAVPAQHIHSGAPLVRRALSEDVAHVAAGHDLQTPSAHPRLREGEVTLWGVGAGPAYGREGMSKLKHNDIQIKDKSHLGFCKLLT